MSFSTTAAARQNEMNESIAVVAMRTLGAVRFVAGGVECSIGRGIGISKSYESVLKKKRP